LPFLVFIIKSTNDKNLNYKVKVMQTSYKVLQRYIKDIKAPEKVAQNLIMHTAEVEEIVEQ